ncbi:MAG: hypothetical protein AAGF11_21695 [Myxococcota bacterium]
MRTPEHPVFATLLVVLLLGTAGCSLILRNASDELRTQQNESEAYAVGDQSGPAAPIPTRSVVHTAARDLGDGLVDGALTSIEGDDNAARLAELRRRLDQATKELAQSAIEGVDDKLPELEQSINHLIAQIRKELNLDPVGQVRTIIREASTQIRRELPAKGEIGSLGNDLVSGLARSLAQQLTVQPHACVYFETPMQAADVDPLAPPAPAGSAAAAPTAPGSSPGSDSAAEPDARADPKQQAPLRRPRVIGLRCFPTGDVDPEDVTLGTRLVMLLEHVGVILDDRIINAGDVVGGQVGGLGETVNKTVDRIGDVSENITTIALSAGIAFLVAIILLLVALYFWSREFGRRRDAQQREQEARSAAEEVSALEAKMTRMLALVTGSIKEAGEAADPVERGEDGQLHRRDRLDLYRQIIKARGKDDAELYADLNRYLLAADMKIERPRSR